MNKQADWQVQRWRARTVLPGAKRELCTQACLLSDAQGAKLLLAYAEDQARPELARIFDQICQAVAVSYGLTAAGQTSIADLPSALPSVIFCEDAIKTTAESHWQRAMTRCEALNIGLHSSVIKAKWWQVITANISSIAK